MRICHEDCTSSSNTLLTAIPTVHIIRAVEDILNTEGKSDLESPRLLVIVFWDTQSIGHGEGTWTRVFLRMGKQIRFFL